MKWLTVGLVLGGCLELTGCAFGASPIATCKLSAEVEASSAQRFMDGVVAFGTEHGYGVFTSDFMTGRNTTTFEYRRLPEIRALRSKAQPPAFVAFLYAVPGQYPAERVRQDARLLAARFSRSPGIHLRALAAENVQSLKAVASGCTAVATK